MVLHTHHHLQLHSKLGSLSHCRTHDYADRECCRLGRSTGHQVKVFFCKENLCVMNNSTTCNYFYSPRSYGTLEGGSTMTFFRVSVIQLFAFLHSCLHIIDFNTKQLRCRILKLEFIRRCGASWRIEAHLSSFHPTKVELIVFSRATMHFSWRARCWIMQCSVIAT